MRLIKSPKFHKQRWSNRREEKKKKARLIDEEKNEDDEERRKEKENKNFATCCASDAWREETRPGLRPGETFLKFGLDTGEFILICFLFLG